MAKKEQESSFPKSPTEIGRRETYMLISPLHKIDRDWAYHRRGKRDVEDEIKLWDLFHEGHKLKGTCKIAKVTIIYEEL
jgi:hypothetical protein